MSMVGLSMVCYHWGSRSPETARVSAPASRLGGATLEVWQYDRRREAVAGAAALVSRQWSPPTNVAENNNNMTFRRIYNKMKIICDIFYQVPHASTRSLLLQTQRVSGTICCTHAVIDIVAVTHRILLMGETELVYSFSSKRAVVYGFSIAIML